VKTEKKLDGCIVLNEHNTVCASKRSAICSRCFPGPTQVLDANGISIASAIFDRLTKPNRLTDHATRSVTIDGGHSGEAKFCYCLWLQQVFTGAVDSTDQMNFNNQQLQSAVRLDGLQCIWRQTAIYTQSKSFLLAYLTGDNCLLTY